MEATTKELLGNVAAMCADRPSPEEEKELLKKAQAGDQEAATRLVNSIGLAIVRAAKYGCSGEEDMLERLQEGYLAAYHAVQKFNVDHDGRFITYAWKCIDTHLRTVRRRVVLKHLKQGTVTDSYLTEMVGVDEREPYMYLEHRESQELWEQYVTKVLEAVASLNDRTADLILQNAYADETSKVAASRTNITRQRVSQVMQKGRKKLAAKIPQFPADSFPNTWDLACCG